MQLMLHNAARKFLCALSSGSPRGCSGKNLLGSHPSDSDNVTVRLATNPEVVWSLDDWLFSSFFAFDHRRRPSSCTTSTAERVHTAGAFESDALLKG